MKYRGGLQLKVQHLNLGKFAQMTSQSTRSNPEDRLSLASHFQQKLRKRVQHFDIARAPDVICKGLKLSRLDQRPGIRPRPIGQRGFPSSV